MLMDFDKRCTSRASFKEYINITMYLHIDRYIVKKTIDGISIKSHLCRNQLNKNRKYQKLQCIIRNTDRNIPSLD